MTFLAIAVVTVLFIVLGMIAGVEFLVARADINDDSKIFTDEYNGSGSWETY